jgi:CheY-like chemotaxis protein
MDRLEVLMFGQDPSLFRIVRSALEDLGIVGCHSCTDSAQAIEVLARRHFDGIILDCDDLAQAQAVLTKIRNGPSNRQSPVIAILNGATDLPAIQNSRPNFNVIRPVSAGTIKEQLKKALDAMQTEHRRYFRYPVALPLFVGTGEDRLTAATLMNVSSEGVAVRLNRSVKPQGRVNLSFKLPSIEPYRIQAKGEVIWTDSEGRMGIKLSYMTGEARRKYMEWLDVLHAQDEFRRLTEEAKATQALTL